MIRLRVSIWALSLDPSDVASYLPHLFMYLQ